MQELFDWVLAGFSTVLGFLLNAVWQAVKDLQKADTELTKRVAEIEVLVAGKYVTRDEFDRTVNRIFEKLDRIERTIIERHDK